MTSYGTDFECLTDITSDLRLADTEGEALAQAILRRLQGRLWHVPGYGFDLLSLVGASGVSPEVLASRVAAEARKDARVRAASLVDTTQSDEVFSFELRVEPKEGQPFVLTASVDLVSGLFSAQGSTERTPARTR